MAAPLSFPTSDFRPNQEALAELLGMGFDQETATQAIYFSGNTASVDAAVTWIFDNQGQSPPALVAAFPQGNQGAGWGAASDWDLDLEVGDAEYKMVIIINNSLGMTKGKTAAQAAHAAVGIYRGIIEDDAPSNRPLHSSLHKWELEGEVTIVLAAESAPHLESLERRAKDHGLCALLVSDAGRTQVAQGAKTALGIFGEKSKVDNIAGTLRPL